MHCDAKQCSGKHELDKHSAPAEPGVYLTVDEVVSSLNTLATSFGFSFGILIMGIELAGFVAQSIAVVL